VATEDQIEGLYLAGKYREVIAIAPISIRAAWSHYQLGELDRAGTIAQFLVLKRPDVTEEASSACLLLAHITERQGNLEGAEELLRLVPADRKRDNLYITILTAKKRRGEEIVAIDAVVLATNAVMRAPYQLVDGHIINNVAWLLHQARDQEDVREFLPTLPGLIELAMGIYESVSVADNHRAAVMYRAALIFEAANWIEGARTLIRQSIELWRELVVREGGDRFQQNLRGAEEVARRLNG